VLTVEQRRLLLATLAASGLSDDPHARAEQIAFLMDVLRGAFEEVGLRVILVGGSAIEVWAPGAHVSDDRDLVITGPPSTVPRPQRAAAVLESLGFVRKGMGWAREQLFLHVVGYDLDEPSVEAILGGHRFEVVKPEVPLADRLVGFRHWQGTTAYALQAAAMLAALGPDLDREWLLERLTREGATEALDAIEEWLASGKPLTEADAEAMQARLQARKPPTTGGAQL
jgi:hypothetical protein